MRCRSHRIVADSPSHNYNLQQNSSGESQFCTTLFYNHIGCPLSHRSVDPENTYRSPQREKDRTVVLRQHSLTNMDLRSNIIAHLRERSASSGNLSTHTHFPSSLRRSLGSRSTSHGSTQMVTDGQLANPSGGAILPAASASLLGQCSSLDTSFVVKLRKMLDQTQLTEDRDIVCWAPRGLTFIIRNKPLFAIRVLPRFFDLGSHASFRMALQQQGFDLVNDPRSGSEIYFHPEFHKENDGTRASAAEQPFLSPFLISQGVLNKEKAKPGFLEHLQNRPSPTGDSEETLQLARQTLLLLKGSGCMNKINASTGQNANLPSAPPLSHGQTDANSTNRKLLASPGSYLTRSTNAEGGKDVADYSETMEDSTVKTSAPTTPRTGSISEFLSRSRRLPIMDNQGPLSPAEAATALMFRSSAVLQKTPGLIEHLKASKGRPRSTSVTLASTSHEARHGLKGFSKESVQGTLPMVAFPSYDGNASSKGTQITHSPVEKVLSDRISREHCERNFLDDLRFMLSSADSGKFDDVISWTPHGRAFRIHKPDELLERVLPNFLGKCSISSFRLSLERYGFKRVSSGPDAGDYFHPLFVRDMPDLCREKSSLQMKVAADLKGESEEGSVCAV